MVVRLGSNIPSLSVQRNLSRSTQDLSTVSERLPSGQRINKASDDAAGLAISMSLNTDSRIFTQGVRNLNDGLSAIGIADAAINELTSITQRIEELAVQSMNGTFSDTQRSSMQKEVTALQAEWNRTVESTRFNGINLLTGDTTRTVLQGGKGTEGTLAVQIGEAQLAGGLEGYGGTGTTRVSTDSGGNRASSSVLSRILISADGRYVAFNSESSALVADDTNGQRDVFIKDTLTERITRVSTASGGIQSTGSAQLSAMSADGRYVAFISGATDLVAGDTNGFSDTFIKDTLTGTTTLISTDSSGNQGNNSSGGNGAAISADGRFVAFNSTASNLVAGDTNGQEDVFIKDILTGVTTRVSTDSAGNEATGGQSYVTAMSADGRYVAFHSLATNLVAGDTNGVRDVFIKDTVTGATTRISTDSSGNQATGGESVVFGISADGRYVLFNSDATNLVAGDTNGQRDAFVKDTVTGTTTRISTDSAGNQATGGFSAATSISADGRFVMFSSEATNLVTGDTNGLRDAFIKDTLTGITLRASVDSAGNEANSVSISGALSADGRYGAFFSMATNLVAGDTNGAPDVFLRDLTRTGVQQMSGMVVNNKASAGVTLRKRGKTPRSRCFARIDADFGREDEGIGSCVPRIPSGAPSKGQGRYTTPVLQRELSF